MEDSDNITVTKNGSIVLKPDFTFGNSGAIGEISYTWEIYDASYKKLGNITTENLVITADSEIINSKTVGTYVIALSIANTAGGVYEMTFTFATIKVVESEATGDIGGKIGSSSSSRTRSARSGDSLEGTTVYLVREGMVVYATDSDASGNYLFTGVPYGQYTIKVDKVGYDEYNETIDVSSASVEHDITIIVHQCFREEGMTMHVSASLPTCSDVTEGTLGNIEYRGCIACGKFYDMEGNLIADSANNPGSLNDMGIPYAALLYPVHDYCGEAQEGGNADQYLRHRADNCLEETTYWYYCIHCRKSAGDDPSVVDMYYVASDSNQTHSYTLEIADENYFYQGGETCKDKIWYYHACEYCGAKGNTVWESNYYGNHIDENADNKCDVCAESIPVISDPDLTPDPETPETPEDPAEKDHSKCLEEASGWKRFWNAIGNFFRRIFSKYATQSCARIIKNGAKYVKNILYRGTTDKNIATTVHPQRETIIAFLRKMLKMQGTNHRNRSPVSCTFLDVRIRDEKGLLPIIIKQRKNSLNPAK